MAFALLAAPCAESYRPELYYFESIALLRRVALVGVSIALSSGALRAERQLAIVASAGIPASQLCFCADPLLQASVVTTLVLLLLVIQIALSPFADEAANRLETASLLALATISAFQGDQRVGVQVFLAVVALAVVLALARAWLLDKFASLQVRCPRLCCLGLCSNRRGRLDEYSQLEQLELRPGL